MVRVLAVLVTLPLLMPQGVCLRKFDCTRWLIQTPATAPAQVRTEKANDRHPSNCRCGCQQLAAQVDGGVDQAGDPVVDLQFHNNSPPQPQEPCCPTICKSKLDKFVQVENPQPCGDVAFAGFAPAPAANACTPPPHRPHVVANAPPLYISYCTLLI